MHPSLLPMPTLPTSLPRNTSGTVQQVVGAAEDPEEKEEEMVLVATTAPGPPSEGCLLDERIIHPPQNGSLPRVANSWQKGSRLKRTC